MTQLVFSRHNTQDGQTMRQSAAPCAYRGCQAKNPYNPSKTKKVCARRFPKGPESAAASGTGACRPLCGKKAGGMSGTTRSGESRDYVGPPEDEGKRSVGIAKEQLAATIAIPGPIGKPFGGAEVAEPQAQKGQLFLEKLLYGLFGISLTAPFAGNRFQMLFCVH